MTAGDESVFAELARQLSADRDLDAVLERVVVTSMSEIEGAEHAGITMISRDSVSTPVATDDLVREVDRQQYTTKQGPCLSAARDTESVVLVNDLQTDSRWPAFSAAIADLPVKAMLSFQLYTDRGTLGALNLYAARAGAFNAESVHVGTLLAAHAAATAASALQNANLLIALNSRDVIGQAKGILMERYKIAADEAFDLLIAASQRSQRKLHAVAAELADTGELTID